MKLMNYGDKNFFEYGFLVEMDNINEDEVYFIYCIPIDGEEDLYLYGEGCVNLNDDWINWEDVNKYSGDDADVYWELMARNAVDYYGLENFCCTYDGYSYGKFTSEHIKKRLAYAYNDSIDWDNVSLEVE